MCGGGRRPLRVWGEWLVVLFLFFFVSFGLAEEWPVLGEETPPPKKKTACRKPWKYCTITNMLINLAMQTTAIICMPHMQNQDTGHISP